MQNRIDGYFEKLTEFINKLPISDKDRNYIWMHSFCQFYDEPVLSENGKTTYGIQTEWQLHRFIEQFEKNFQKLRIKAVEKWTDELNNIEPSEAVAKINKQIYSIRKKELLSEIGADGLNDWDRWLQMYLSNEIDHQQKRPTRKQPKQQKKTSYVWQSNPKKELPELYNRMSGVYNLIAPETTYEQFNAIFTGQPVESITPIKWHDDNATELLYFIGAIKDKVDPVWQIYKRLTSCFVKSDGKPFTASFKELNQNISFNLGQAKKTAIDRLVKNL